MELLVELLERDHLTSGKLQFVGPDLLDDGRKVLVLVPLKPLLLKVVEALKITVKNCPIGIIF